ncbi:putative non-specific serine/threonine protein kinase [Helianthus anomalus]
MQYETTFITFLFQTAIFGKISEPNNDLLKDVVFDRNCVEDRCFIWQPTLICNKNPGSPKGTLFSLNHLFLQKNHLSNQLYYLFLHKNQLHGNLPSSIDNLVGLEVLSLGYNQFTGNIPSTIGNLQKLEKLGLFDNQLFGKIPDSIGNLSSLIILALSSNMLEGVIPPSMGNFHHLLQLYLSDNKLNGEIPIQNFQLSSFSIKLDLSQNNLSGSLPTEVGGLDMCKTSEILVQ